jgi:crotonobetainyl-CoA:carnitine CoA-transferase CaiB-like acyl-CoA transferase
MTAVLMGPSATQALGDMGAEVIKVEPPEGDLVRQIGPARHCGMGPMFINANRSKRSIVIDLKHRDGGALLQRMAAWADVLVYNMRPRAMARLGLTYEALAEVNPGLIYAGLLGFGQDGPYADRPAYDDLIQGAAAIPYLYVKAKGGEPRYAPSAIADRIVGLSAVGAILAALLERGRTGKGQQVDVPMMETMVSFILADHLGGLTFEPPLDKGGYSRQLSSDRRPYRTLDGYICAMVYNDKQWRSFTQAIGMADLMERDSRFADFKARTANIEFVHAELARIFMTRSSKEWLGLLEKADVPCMPMHDLESVLTDPHLTRTGFFQTQYHPTEGKIRDMRVAAQWSRTPAQPQRLAPVLGEHTVEVLREIGLSEQEISALRKSGAIIQAITRRAATGAAPHLPGTEAQDRA